MVLCKINRKESPRGTSRCTCPGNRLHYGGSPRKWERKACNPIKMEWSQRAREGERRTRENPKSRNQSTDLSVGVSFAGNLTPTVGAVCGKHKIKLQT
ncbi:hypothetical protein ACFX1T_034372 [Malus domestica]